MLGVFVEVRISTRIDGDALLASERLDYWESSSDDMDYDLQQFRDA